MTSLMTYTPQDIDLQLAIRAHSGTSFSPEKRGQSYVDGYMAHMGEVEAKFAAFATDDNRAELTAALENYRVKYIELLNAYLYSHSNVMSTMIAGPANFPSARNRKRSEWADNHRNRWLDWIKAQLDRLDKRFNPAAIARAAYVVRIGEADAVERMQAKITEAEERQAFMKAVNKIAKSRKKGYTDDEKVADLQAEFGISERAAREVMTPNVFGVVGFETYQLSNNNANIRRMKGRLIELERLAEATAVSRDIADGVTYEECPEDGRVRLRFPDKPNAEIRALLKRNGFRWSPSNGAWQRVLNSNGKSAVRSVTAAIAAEYGEVS